MECVSFDSAEEIVVAGATGGTVKLWDLEQAKGMHANALKNAQASCTVKSQHWLHCKECAFLHICTCKRQTFLHLGQESNVPAHVQLSEP